MQNMTLANRFFLRYFSRKSQIGIKNSIRQQSLDVNWRLIYCMQIAFWYIKHGSFAHLAQYKTSSIHESPTRTIPTGATTVQQFTIPHMAVSLSMLSEVCNTEYVAKVVFLYLDHFFNICCAILIAVLAPLLFPAAKQSRYKGLFLELHSNRGFSATSSNTVFNR